MNCDVCGQKLMQSGNSNLYYCSIQTKWIESMKRHLKYHHCFVSLNNSKNVESKLITVPPYIFQIDYESNKTKITKITEFKQKGLINDVFTLDLDHEEKEYLEISVPVSSIIKLPWNDAEKIEEKLKIYNLFS